MSVLVWHYYVGLQTPNTELHAVLKKVLNQTWTGVDLFFVLSGFLIGGILMDHKEGKGYFKVFYIRRACRILPLYSILLLSFAICFYFIDWDSNSALSPLLNNPYPIWGYLLFLQNFFNAMYHSWGPQWLGVTWSLAIEEQFYLLLPLAIRFISKKNIPIFIFSMFLMAPLFRIFILNGIEESYRHEFYIVQSLLFSRMDSLLLGVIGAWIIRTSSIREYLRENIHFLYIICFILGAGMFFFARSGLNAIFFSITSSIGYTWIATYYLSLILIVLLSSNKIIQTSINYKPLRMMGIISYFIYLFHQPINGIVHFSITGHGPTLSDGSGVMATIFALLLTLTLAAGSWWLIEKPFLALGKKFNY